jgi:hypothetical protein
MKPERAVYIALDYCCKCRFRQIKVKYLINCNVVPLILAYR